MSTKHIIGLVYATILIVAPIVCGLIWLRNKPEKIKMLPLKVIAIALPVLEIIKHIYLMKVYGYLPIGAYPLFLCSMFIWTFPVAVFSKGKASEYAWAFSALLGILAGLSVLIMPTAAMDIENKPSWFPLSENFEAFHSFTFHALIILFALYALVMKLYRPTFKKVIKCYIVAAICAVVAIIANLYIVDAGFYLLGNGTNGNFLDTVIEKISYTGYVALFYILGFPLCAVTWVPYGITDYLKRRKQEQAEAVNDTANETVGNTINNDEAAVENYE